MRLLARAGYETSYMCYGSPVDEALVNVSLIPRCDMDYLASRFGSSDGMVFFHGGGNWGDLWTSPHDFRLDCMSRLAKGSGRMASFPQSLHYTTDAADVGLRRDAAVMEKVGSMANLTLLWRQQDSMETASRWFATVDNVLTPDAAWAIGPIFRQGAPEYEILLLLRRDKESTPSSELTEAEAFALLSKTGTTFQIMDWVDIELPTFGDNWFQAHDLLFSAAVSQLSKGRVLVTNRLHSTILATLMDMPVFYFDNTYGKINQTRATSLQHSSCTGDVLRAWQFPSISASVVAALEWIRDNGS